MITVELKRKWEFGKGVFFFGVFFCLIQGGLYFGCAFACLYSRELNAITTEVDRDLRLDSNEM